MIYDRTQTDVNSAVEIRDNKVKNFQELTPGEIDILERGIFTINTLNRIEQKQNELNNILLNYGYVANCENKVDWTVTDIPNETDYVRILSNLNRLKTTFSYMQSTPNTPTNMFHFEKLNDVEKILVDIEFLIGSMVSSWIYASNEFYVGG